MRRMLKRIGLFLFLFVIMRYAVTTPGLLHALGTGVWLLAQKVEVSAHHIQPSDANSSILGKPTISVQQINTILAAYHSPAAGLGQNIYTLGVQDGIDPVHVLAIFLHESRMGTTGEATTTMSPGNERCISDRPCVDGGYAHMYSWKDGFAHLYSLLFYGYIQGAVTIPIVGHVCSTIDQIVPVFAPSSDHNAVQGYIQAWKDAVQAWRAGAVKV